MPNVRNKKQNSQQARMRRARLLDHSKRYRRHLLCERLEPRIVLSSVQETESNDNLVSATALPFYEDPAGSGFLTSAIALGSIDPNNDTDYWSFDAQEGDRVGFDLERTSGGTGPRVIFYNAAAEIVADTYNSYSWFGTPSKTTLPTFSIPADGTYYVRILNWSGHSGTYTYEFRVDMGRDVQLEYYDYNFYNNDTGHASGLELRGG